MMKAITPVISIIILLLITISLSGMGWTYMSGYYEAMTAKQIKLVEGSAYGNEVMILNIGTSEISEDDLRIMVGGKEAETMDMNPGTIEPKKSARIIFKPTALGNTNIRVLAPGNSISYTEDINSENVYTWTSCKDIIDSVGSADDGAYYIDPDGFGGNSYFEVYCDMTTDGGGWVRLDSRIYDEDERLDWLYFLWTDPDTWCAECRDTWPKYVRRDNPATYGYFADWKLTPDFIYTETRYDNSDELCSTSSDPDCGTVLWVDTTNQRIRSEYETPINAIMDYIYYR